MFNNFTIWKLKWFPLLPMIPSVNGSSWKKGEQQKEKVKTSYLKRRKWRTLKC